MITKEQIIESTCIDKGRYIICFQCKKILDKQYYRLILWVPNKGAVEYYGEEKIQKYIGFCIKCWEEIAGEEYCFSE